MTLGETFLLSCAECTLSFSVTAVFNFLVESGKMVCLCAGTCLLSRLNRTFPPDISLVMTPVRRSWSLILSSVSTLKLFSHLAPETTVLTAEMHTHLSNIVMKNCIPSLIDYLYVAMVHCIALLLQYKYSLCPRKTAQQQNHK